MVLPPPYGPHLLDLRVLAIVDKFKAPVPFLPDQHFVSHLASRPRRSFPVIDYDAVRCCFPREIHEQVNGEKRGNRGREDKYAFYFNVSLARVKRAQQVNPSLAVMTAAQHLGAETVLQRTRTEGVEGWDVRPANAAAANGSGLARASDSSGVGANAASPCPSHHAAPNQQ